VLVACVENEPMTMRSINEARFVLTQIRIKGRVNDDISSTY
jgi:hypothetical protein